MDIQKKTKLFIAYAETFLTGNKEIDRNIRLKIAHTLRVVNETRTLCAAETEAGAVTELALATSLFHDVSRFSQLREYKTYNDARSFDHGERSAELVEELKFLPEFSTAERLDLCNAVRSHNKLAIPEHLNARSTLLARIVRDYDKIDIIGSLLTELNNPENKVLCFGLAYAEKLSPAVKEALENFRFVRNCDLKSSSDFIAAKLPWSLDLNFARSKSEFRRRKYNEQILKFLPDTEEIRKIYALYSR